MKLNFNTVSYEGDLDDADEEQLRSLVSEYEDAQESNAAEFEAAKDSIDELEEVEAAEYQDARADLVEDITERDSFDEAPLDEDDLADASFAKLREYNAYFAAQDLAAEQESAESEEDSEFDDMGQKAPTHEEPDEGEFAEEYLGDIPGVNF